MTPTQLEEISARVDHAKGIANPVPASLIHDAEALVAEVRRLRAAPEKQHQWNTACVAAQIAGSERAFEASRAALKGEP